MREKFRPLYNRETAEALVQQTEDSHNSGTYNIEVYFNIKGIRDHLIKAILRSAAKTRALFYATLEEWDALYASDYLGGKQ